VEADRPRVEGQARLSGPADTPGESTDSTEPAPSTRASDSAPTLALGGWRVSWDDGLRFELRRLVPGLPGPGWLPPEIQDGHPLVSGTVGVKLQVDGAAYRADRGLPDVSSDVEVRRGRVFAEGELFFLRPIIFKVEFGVTTDSVFLNDFYVGLRDLPVLGTLKVGHLKPPFSLERLTSGLDTPFMERAAPVDAFAPGYLAGLSVQNDGFDGRMTGALGWFVDGAGDDTGDASDSVSRIIGRVTWLPYDDRSSASARLVHLGFSASHVFSASDGVRYRSRPESHLAPIFVDTGDIEADTASVWGLEAVAVNGPFSVRAEGLLARVDADRGDALIFWGFYLAGGWMLTGESRPYDRRTGLFRPVAPRQPFSFRRGQPGAWEWGVRWSYVDLDDGGVRGGRMGILSTGLNWYLDRHWRVTLEYGFTRLQGRGDDGDLHTVQSRIQVRF
jgi:phosphate-selective porin OprO/OprP